jgi:hypothetical protein
MRQHRWKAAVSAAMVVAVLVMGSARLLHADHSWHARAISRALVATNGSAQACSATDYPLLPFLALLVLPNVGFAPIFLADTTPHTSLVQFRQHIRPPPSI